MEVSGGVGEEKMRKGWGDGEMVLFIGNGFESCLWQVEGEELECWVVRSERDDGGELRGFGCT